MEVWILLAAAGSGYLARRWQNAQKPKGSSADEAEDDNRAGHLQEMPSSRGQYRRFSSSSRRQFGKSMHGKGSPHWVRPKSTSNLMEIKGESNLMGEENGKKLNGSHTCDNANECEICLDSRGFNDALSRSIVHLSDTENEGTHPEERYGDNLSSKRPSVSCGGNLWKQTQNNERDGLEWDTQENYTNGQGGGNLSDPSLLKSVSGKRPNDSLDVKMQRGRQQHQDGCAGKRMKDALDSSNTHKLNENCVFGSWMPGFWDVSEGIFVLDTESFLVQPGERSRGSSSRRSRTPSKYGRNKGFRKKRLAGQKPMSSLESCLSAQLGEDYFKKHTKNITQPDDEFSKDSGMRMSGHSASFATESSIHISKKEFALGLPSLFRVQSSKRFPSKERIPRISTDNRETSKKPFNPFACGRNENADSSESKNKKGKSSCSRKGLLFNFGVGVGMMFTVMSNMREVRRLTLLLKEAESLIKDLEDELEKKEDSKSDIGPDKHDPKLEQRQYFVANTLRKVKSATESLCNMRMILPTEPGPLSIMKHAPSKDMSKLEAELEAELARMEFSLNDGENAKPQNGLRELDVGAGNVEHGELTILGVPHELEAYSDEDSSNSSHEDLHVQNYAVSPRALAKRLHEVLEAQHEERICELEAELKSLSSKLQAKEEEARWLKEKSRGFHATVDMEGFSAVEGKLQQISPSHAQQNGSRRKEPKSLLKIVRSPNPSPGSPYTSCKGFNDASLINKGMENKNTAFLTLGGEALEAYKEACDEFSKLSIGGSDNTVIAEGIVSERHSEETCAQEGKVELKHPGTSDGWEQVDLLSLAQDFYGDDHELLRSTSILSKGSSKERHGHRRKSRIKGHPEPENFFSSRTVDSSDDGTNDTSGSTPCSIKFMDVRTAGYSGHDWKQGGEAVDDAVLPAYLDWNQEILINAGANTPDQKDYESIHLEQEASSSKFLSSSKPVDWKLPDDTDYCSELDEHLGQLLIKRIVEKSRKGSPIVQDAQTVLTLLERNEPKHASD